MHTNPGSDKARGHLGSSLQRKAETVLFVHRVGDTSVVEPQFCRNEPFERFAFTINEEGIPEICDLPNEHSDERHPAVALLEDTFGGAIERLTLVNKLVEIHGLKKTTAQMQIARLIKRGVLIANGGVVQTARVTESHSHIVTGGGGSVTSVTKCDERETVDEFNELNGSDGFNEFNGSNGLNGAAATACPAQDHLSHQSHLPHPTQPTPPTQAPLYERIHDMFPDIKPQQSMAAWDDDCPF